MKLLTVIFALLESIFVIVSIYFIGDATETLSAVKWLAVLVYCMISSTARVLMDRK